MGGKGKGDRGGEGPPAFGSHPPLRLNPRYNPVVVSLSFYVTSCDDDGHGFFSGRCSPRGWIEGLTDIDALARSSFADLKNTTFKHFISLYYLFFYK